MAEAIKKARPVYRNIGLGDIARYRLPWAGKVSILHRASGARGDRGQGRGRSG